MSLCDKCGYGWSLCDCARFEPKNKPMDISVDELRVLYENSQRSLATKKNEIKELKRIICSVCGTPEKGNKAINDWYDASR